MMWRLTRLFPLTPTPLLRGSINCWNGTWSSSHQMTWSLRFKEILKLDREKWCPVVRRKLCSGSGKPSVMLKICLGVATGCGIKLGSGSFIVWCQTDQVHSRITGISGGKEDKKEPKFDWKQFLRLLWPHIWYLVAAVAGAFVVAFLNIQIPQLLGGIVNIVAKFTRGEGGNLFVEEIKQPGKRLISMYLLQAGFTFLYIYILSCIGEQIAMQMKQDLFKSIMRQDIAFFDQQRTGEIINRLTTDIQDFKSSFKLCIAQGLRSVAQIAGCSLSLFIISPQMTWGMLVVVPTVVLLGTLIGSLLRKLSRDAQDQGGKATIVGEEAISNIRTVRAFAMESTECQLFNDETEEARKLNQRLGFGIGLFQAGTNLFLNGLVLGTLYAGGYLLSTNQVTPGDLMSFLVATQTIQRSLAQLSLLFGHVVKGLGAGARVYEFINLEPSMNLVGGRTIPYHSLIADVAFNNVHFSYPTRPQQMVLKNFNLRLPPGKTVAVVGSSGNGKSTIAALLERFYDINGGSITIDGVDIRDLDPTWLRGRAIGFINQEPILFATSIMENIRYGNPLATDEEVLEVAKLANADEFIRKFPEGYATLVGERGSSISGGQKQRVAIARALLKNPSILILDEATSALDSESEKLVQMALDNVIKGRTVLVIAHRLSTIQNADIIVVLNNGVIVEMGNHESLKKLKGLYWNLIRQQEQADETTRSLW